MVHKQATSESGFALLMSLIVVGVLLSIGLTFLELSISQVQLSTNARDSERAFHAANAGMECGRYWRRVASDLMETGQDISPSCFVAPAVTASAGAVAGAVGTGDAYLYEYEFTWGTNNDRCSEISSLVMVASSTGAGLTVNDVANIIPGYRGPVNKLCAAGERCTVQAARGYNRACGQTSNFGTIQREVLLEF